MSDKKEHKWLDRHPVLHPDDVNDLERDAALHEFKHKKPRGKAESDAYSDYLTRVWADAAAHHLVGIRIAHAAKDKDTARKHGVLYVAAVKKMGGAPVGTPPDAVVAALEKVKAPYKFKNHHADAWLTDTDMAKAEETVRQNEDCPVLTKGSADTFDTVTDWTHVLDGNDIAAGYGIKVITSPENESSVVLVKSDTGYDIPVAVIDKSVGIDMDRIDDRLADAVVHVWKHFSPEHADEIRTHQALARIRDKVRGLRDKLKG